MRWCWAFVSDSSKSDAHHMFIIWLGEWDALAVATGIFLGPIAMGWLIHDFALKEHATLLWFVVVVPVYWYIETSEPVAQLKLYSGLDSDRTGQQRISLMFPIIGAFGAVGVWLLSLVSGKEAFIINYGIYEWILILHTIYMSIKMTPLFNLMLDKIYQALSGQFRREQSVKND